MQISVKSVGFAGQTCHFKRSWTGQMGCLTLQCRSLLNESRVSTYWVYICHGTWASVAASVHPIIEAGIQSIPRIPSSLSSLSLPFGGCHAAFSIRKPWAFTIIQLVLACFGIFDFFRISVFFRRRSSFLVLLDVIGSSANLSTVLRPRWDEKGN